MALNDRIKAARTAKGFTLDEVAAKVGVSRQTIQRYESGVISNIPSDNIEKLAVALDTTPAELMGWAGPPPKVTTTMTFDGDSPMHDLTQAYLRHPKAVQDEILVRLDRLDATFSKNVSMLLMDSGDVNGFMQNTGLDFPRVGKLMQGETVWTTPEEAERIAAYFGTDVVKLFFEEVYKKGKAQNVSKESDTEFINRLGIHARRVFYSYQRECELNGWPDPKEADKARMVIGSPKFNRLLQRIIEESPDDTSFSESYAKLARALYLDPSKLLARWLVSDKGLQNLKFIMFDAQEDTGDP